jgi:Phage integrase, N-terminal SAM-like domain
VQCNQESCSSFELVAYEELTRELLSIRLVDPLGERIRYPREVGSPEVEAFLTHLAMDGHVAPSTHNHALAAILFLYRQVVEINLPWLQVSAEGV